MMRSKTSAIGHERTLIASLAAKVLSLVEVALQQVEANRKRSALRSQIFVRSEFRDHGVDRPIGSHDLIVGPLDGLMRQFNNRSFQGADKFSSPL
jgi:hypothetical protein